MTEQRPLRSLEVMVAADRVLLGGGYRPVLDVPWRGWGSSARAYEDEYGVVGLFVFDTAESIDRDWASAQADLVALMSAHLNRDDAKAWDGYLVLLTPAQADIALRSRLDEIRRDTSRVRKIVATGDQLDTLGGVERSLLPLLPLEAEGAGEAPGTALDALPDLLERQGIGSDVSMRVIEAFNRQTSLIRALHETDSVR